MQSKRGILLIVLALVLLVSWNYIIHLIWPTTPAPQKPHQETVAMAAGSMAAVVEPGSKLKQAADAEKMPLPPKDEEKKDEKKEPEPPPDPQIQVQKLLKDAPELIPLGHGANGKEPYYLQVMLNSRGGSVQQVIVTKFPAASREGLEVVEKVDGKDTPVPLHLVPGVRLERQDSMRQKPNNSEFVMTPGLVRDLATYDKLLLAGSSYVMYHYEKPGDERPLNELGIRNWKVVERSLDPDADEQTVVFRTELAEPHNLEITKTFTLKRKEYHIGLQVDIKRIEGKKGPNQFRYQLSGAHGLPIEGEWYTSTYRQAIVGFADDRSGKTPRFIEDARSIRETEGSDRQARTDKLAIRYAAVTVQYFASAIAVDDQQENRNFVEFVRATPIGKSHKGKEFLDDLTVRAITEAFNTDQETSHKYMLYNGPIKVRLLRQMPADAAVDDGLVDRYLDKLHLDTMTDAPMNNFLGRVANAIYWTDLVIAFTNLIHSLLWLLLQVIPSLGICIVIVTVIVRGLLFPLSRRQTYKMQVMQQKMAKLQPELKKIEENFKGDAQRVHQEKFKYMREHGVNPLAGMGGCLMMLLQMPIMMGLYYALQESVFFRLDTFLWMPNLAAPDMLVFWGESIPFISLPTDLGSTFYLGPYLNILPIVAVTLMLYQQKKMMPPSDDPQVQSQQKMMKFMMIIMGLFFYKVAAGLCIYFIASTIWGVIERKFIPKPGEEPEKNANQSDIPEEPKQLGWWGRRKALWREKWKEILDQAQKQAEHRREQQRQPQPPAGPDRGNGPGGKKKKKKKR
jgi:YidC/Oxa1 family membrane protein insertase